MPELSASIMYLAESQVLGEEGQQPRGGRIAHTLASSSVLVQLCSSHHLTHPPVYLQSRSRLSDEIPLTFRADIFRLLFCRSAWPRWTPFLRVPPPPRLSSVPPPVTPAWPSYEAALAAKSGPAHPGTEELEWRAPPSLTKPPPHLHALKPAKSTELSRSDGRGQNSI
ncbi:unnamed protein product [Pleuronectes platessa]|uniref:Uncharacterized protein n=1 Tax=Pleuronectes platessa TaxID=8262 RepID=A0A9N7YA63_PLEPL|nr:unnamed protein product [Pleuronectes platessa]